MESLRSVMFQRLRRMGLSDQSIPGFLRDVRNIRKSLHNVGIRELNARIRWLGWGDISLDYHTYQLIVANDQRVKRQDAGQLGRRTGWVIHPAGVRPGSAGPKLPA